ncbi:MAG: hypothetical protein WC505_07770 [Patescibacteria group bacterium]
MRYVNHTVPLGASIILLGFIAFFMLLRVYWLAAALAVPLIPLAIILAGARGFSAAERWGHAHQLTVTHSSARLSIEARFRANPGKALYSARSFLSEIDESRIGPFISGTVKGRPVWAYPFYGRHDLQPSLIDTRGRSRYMRGWFVEIATHRMPVSLRISKRRLAEHDDIDTESRVFEKLYHVDVIDGYGTLQLLEPVMIEHITNSGISSLEFSDQSVVLLYSLSHPPVQVLDRMLETGIKIAEQVDRNFPMGKY